MINRVILVGRITKDPEVKSTQSNIAVVALHLLSTVNLLINQEKDKLTSYNASFGANKQKI
jgi:single-stranded DNA-binding protein